MPCAVLQAITLQTAGRAMQSHRSVHSASYAGGPSGFPRFLLFSTLHPTTAMGPDALLNLDIFRQLADTALTSDAPIEEHCANGLPNTFVPGRNLIFILHAAAWAYAKEIRHMPEVSLRTIPARSKSLWLITSASAGDSLRVGI